MGEGKGNTTVAKLAEEAKVAGLQATLLALEEEKFYRNRLELASVHRKIKEKQARISVYEHTEKKERTSLTTPLPKHMISPVGKDIPNQSVAGEKLEVSIGGGFNHTLCQSVSKTVNNGALDQS